MTVHNQTDPINTKSRNKKRLREFQKYFNYTKNFNKCFGIGANKTGTTSLEVICKKLYGMRSKQRPGVASVHQIFQGNYSTLTEHLDQQDFHQDLPTSIHHYYVALDILYPNSKFILTLRDSSSWFESFFNYYYSSKIKTYLYPELARKSYLIFPGHDKWFETAWGKELSLLNDIRTHSFKTDKDLKNSIIRTSSFRDACINSYESRISCIQSYFANRNDDLLQVQLSDPSLSTKINKFFNLPENILVYSSPRKNSRIKSRDSKQGLEFTLNF